MVPTIKTVAKYDSHREYAVDFFGDDVIVTVTPSAAVVRRWIRNALYFNRFRRHRLVAGTGVQWTPDSSDPDPLADTLQLCIGRRCLIVQLRYCERVPNILRRFLADATTTFVGIWNSQDAKKLSKSRHALEIGKLLDVRKYVEDSDGRILTGASFEEIVEQCLGHEGVRLDSEISMSDWNRYILRHNQILQASVDAYVCCKLGVEESLWRV